MNKNFKSSCIVGIILFTSSFFSVSAEVLTGNPIGDGTYTGWSPSTGNTHYSLVSEDSCNGRTDYVSADTAGDRDSYVVNLASIPNGSTITGIAITPCASRSNNGTDVGTLNVFYRLNNINSIDSGSYTITGNTPKSLTATNFSDLSIVKTSTSSLEIGAVFTAGKKECSFK